MNKKTKILIGLVVTIVILSGALKITPQLKAHYELVEIESANQEAIKQITEADIIKPKDGTAEEEPLERAPTSKKAEKGYIDVDFICQAPLETEANWTLHEESCEEAALLMAFNYENNISITKEDANEKILKMIDWQKENMGGHTDLYADGIKELAQGFYNIEGSKIKIIYNAKISDIEDEILRGNPVIVPITGEILQNPYYPYPGYHMLLVKGFTKDRIITNDNGTRRGKDFSYDKNIFQAAMNDAGGDVVILEP